MVNFQDMCGDKNLYGRHANVFAFLCLKELKQFEKANIIKKRVLKWRSAVVNIDEDEIEQYFDDFKVLFEKTSKMNTIKFNEDSDKKKRIKKLLYKFVIGYVACEEFFLNAALEKISYFLNYQDFYHCFYQANIHRQIQKKQSNLFSTSEILDFCKYESKLLQKHILLIESITNITSIFRICIEDILNIKTHCCSWDYEDIRNTITNNKIDLIIFTGMYKLPVINLVNNIRKNHDIPIILCSGRTEELLDSFLEIEVEGYLEKPFVIETLELLITNGLIRRF